MSEPPNRIDQIQTAVKQVESLIKLRFPDPHPDVFTLRDFRVRHKFMGFGEAATQTIAKSQRINRQKNNFSRIGLCEFHIGLIYFYNNDCMGAMQHFSNARYQWGFVNEPTGTAIAYLAQGLAQQLYWQYEAAMNNYTKAQALLPRIARLPATREHNQLFNSLTDMLSQKQRQLERHLWEADNLATAVPPPEEPDSDTTAPPPSDTPSPPSSASLDVITESKQAEKNVEQPTPPPPSPPLSSAPFPPVIRFDTGIPSDFTIIPGHHQNDPNYGWFQILNEPQSSFFPSEVQKEGWVLIFKRKQEGMGRGELVVVGHEDDTLLDHHAVRLQPLIGLQPYPIITLAWLDDLDEQVENKAHSVSDRIEHVDLSTSPEMSLIPTRMSKIIGVVVGFWHPVRIQ